MSKVVNDVIILDRGNYTTCCIHLHGGTIVSYRVKDNELLYMKKKTTFDRITPIRGGIKYTFPYFGRPNNGPRHGFGRYVPWRLVSGPTNLPNGDVQAELALEESEYTKSIWNYQFKISYKVILGLTQLTMSVKVENTSKYFPFYFNIMRYAIFKVDDVTKVGIYGLSKCLHYKFDMKKKDIKYSDFLEDKVTIDREFFDVYHDTSPVIDITDVDNAGMNLRIIQCDDASPDVLVYNPWIQKGKVLDDEQHAKGEYTHCLGMAHGHVYSNIRLKPGEIWQSKQIIEVVDDEFNKKIEKFSCLLNDPWTLFKKVCDPKVVKEL